MLPAAWEQDALPETLIAPGLLPGQDLAVPEAAEDVAPAAHVHAAQVHAERHESITITQQANASPGSVVIQVAGNAKIGDET